MTVETFPLPRLTIIVAADRARGIGIGNALPWRLPEDLAHFKRTTSGHAIVMGRQTFESIGRALPNRRNIVVTRNPQWRHEGVQAAPTLAAAAACARGDEIFIIGGAQIYAAAMPLATRLVVTEIDGVFECDAFFPAIDPLLWQEVERRPQHSAGTGIDYAFVTYERRRA